MIEHLPWIIAGLAVGLFVGYAFGKFRGSREVSEGAGIDDSPAEAQTKTTDERAPKTEADAGVTVYVRRGGSHYHKEGCHHLHGHGHRLTNTAAAKQKYKPCPSCRPQ